MVKRFAALVAGAVACAIALSACSKIEIPPYLRPLSKDTMMLLGKKGMELKSPVFVRVFKEESELELWKQRADGRFYHFKTYPICNWSGGLGPKIKQGDMQAPEGFYTIAKYQMNPNSSYHLAFNLGYPNAFDKANGRTGNFLMIHGKCRSAGCYAMTDALIEEIYALARETFVAGQDDFQVHAYPFRMTDANMLRHRQSPHYKFWLTMKEGYDYFELTRKPPDIVVCERRYNVNAKVNDGGKPRADGYCPRLSRPKPEPFAPMADGQAAGQIAGQVVVQGPKMRVAGGATVIDTSARSIVSGSAGTPSLGYGSRGGAGANVLGPSLLGLTP